MTCIVGLVDNGKVYIGGDSAGVDERWNLTIRADKKVFSRKFPTFDHYEEMLLGFTTSFRMGQLLQYQLEIPPTGGWSFPEQLFEYMATVFVDTVRKCLKEGGFAEKDKEAEKGGAFLVGFRGRLFCVENDYQVAEALDGYYAIGYGAAPALGVLYATPTLPPRTRIEMALGAAEHFNIGVRAPFTILESGKTEPTPIFVPSPTHPNEWAQKEKA